MRTRGYSLIEAILASFLLVFTFFLVSSLFNTGLQYSTRVESRLLAVQIAERRMAEIRSAAQGHTWTSASEGPDPENPAFKVKVEPQTLTLFSPSTELEAAFPGNGREMRGAARQYAVTVTGGRSSSFRLVSVVTEGSSAEATRTWTVRPSYGVPAWIDNSCRVEITGTIPSSVGPDDSVRLAARAFDANGDEIKDLFFHWEVEPDFGDSNPSSGDIRGNQRDGRTSIFRNRVRLRDGTRFPQNGSCLVMAYARYDGALVTGKTSPIRLHRPPDYAIP